MFYRQKILLALIEVSGRKIQNTDLEKLLFLFCQETKKNHYDFFPYKYGAFSFMSYYDKRKLVEKGHLKNCGHFELATSTSSYLNQLKSVDRLAIQSFSTKTQGLRGQQLIRKTYLEYPQFATKSHIINQVLTVAEQKEIHSKSKNEHSASLFTIGYEGRTIDEYLRCLTIHDVKTLIDVRKNPLSRKHGFSKKGMKKYLESAGIKYLHYPELGIASHLRKSLSDKASYEMLFEQYAKDTLPNQQERLDQVKKITEEHKRVALTCFEADHIMCHRHKVVEAIKSDSKFNYPVVHI